VIKCCGERGCRRGRGIESEAVWLLRLSVGLCFSLFCQSVAFQRAAAACASFLCIFVYFFGRSRRDLSICSSGSRPAKCFLLFCVWRARAPPMQGRRKRGERCGGRARKWKGRVVFASCSRKKLRGRGRRTDAAAAGGRTCARVLHLFLTPMGEGKRGHAQGGCATPVRVPVVLRRGGRAPWTRRPPGNARQRPPLNGDDEGAQTEKQGRVGDGWGQEARAEEQGARGCEPLTGSRSP